MRWPNGDLSWVGTLGQRWRVLHTDEDGRLPACSDRSEAFEVVENSVTLQPIPLEIVVNDLELTQGTQTLTTAPLEPRVQTDCMEE